MSENILGIIGIKNQTVSCIIGIHSEERVKEQEVEIEIKIKIDFSPCLKSGSIQDTADYIEIANKCESLAKEKKYELLETFAHDIMRWLKARYNPYWAWTCVRKPGAIENADYAWVELEYFR